LLNRQLLKLLNLLMNKLHILQLNACLFTFIFIKISAEFSALLTYNPIQ
jgi:hypothetical protein